MTTRAVCAALPPLPPRPLFLVIVVLRRLTPFPFPAVPSMCPLYVVFVTLGMSPWEPRPSPSREMATFIVPVFGGSVLSIPVSTLTLLCATVPVVVTVGPLPTPVSPLPVVAPVAIPSIPFFAPPPPPPPKSFCLYSLFRPRPTLLAFLLFSLLSSILGGLSLGAKDAFVVVISAANNG